MKKKISIILLIFSAICILNACSKSDPAIVNTVNNGQGSAQWTFDGVASSSDSSYASVANKRIMAYRDLSTVQSKTISLNLSSLTVGNYSLSAALPNVLIYRISTTVDHISQSGTVNITSNTGTKLSGNFTALMSNGLTLSGTFTDVPMR